MNWFRMYNEARNDAKLRALNDNEFRVWFKLLCLSSEQKVRGSIQDIDFDLLALEVADGNSEMLNDTVKKLIKLRIITHNDDRITFINFLKRQHDYPSDYPERTRARKQQQRDRDSEPVTTMSRPCHDESRESHGLSLPNRTEQIREEQSISTPPTASFSENDSIEESSDEKTILDELVLAFHKKFPKQRLKYSVAGAVKCRDEFAQRLKDGWKQEDIRNQIAWYEKNDCPAPWDLFAEKLEQPKWGPGTPYATADEFYSRF